VAKRRESLDRVHRGSYLAGCGTLFEGGKTSDSKHAKRFPGENDSYRGRSNLATLELVRSNT
jgi:hypothetical protein